MISAMPIEVQPGLHDGGDHHQEQDRRHCEQNVDAPGDDLVDRTAEIGADETDAPPSRDAERSRR